MRLIRIGGGRLADGARLEAKKRTVKAALNNSFGFGGTNASLIVKKVD